MARKTKAPDLNAAIQYRPGNVFGRVIADFASQWNVSRHDAAKRLALLATYELPVTLYSEIDAFGRELDSIRGFEDAIPRIHSAIVSADALRAQQGEQPLAAVKERLQQIQIVIQQLRQNWLYLEPRKKQEEHVQNQLYLR